MPITTVYNFPTTSDFVGGHDFGNTTYRMVFIGSLWLANPVGATQVRISLLTSSVLAGGSVNPLTSFYFEQQGAGSLWDFSSTPAHITFGGSDGIGTVGPSQTVVSDWITLPENFDATKNYVAAWYAAVGSAQTQASTGNNNFPNSGYGIYDNEPAFGGNDASTVVTNPANYAGIANFFPNSQVLLITKIEVQSPNAAAASLQLGLAASEW